MIWLQCHCCGHFTFFSQIASNVRRPPEGDNSTGCALVTWFQDWSTVLIQLCLSHSSYPRFIYGANCSTYWKSSLTSLYQAPPTGPYYSLTGIYLPVKGWQCLLKVKQSPHPFLPRGGKNTTSSCRTSSENSTALSPHFEASPEQSGTVHLLPRCLLPALPLSENLPIATLLSHLRKEPSAPPKAMSLQYEATNSFLQLQVP